MAHSMKMPEAKADPVKKLPPEILNLIFSFLDISLLLCVPPPLTSSPASSN